MYYNDYSLRQLLELALRVPEVGAVNFNILYYILKTIIQKQGLEGIKPVFSFDTPITGPNAAAKTKLKGLPLQRSFSAETLQNNEFKKNADAESDGSERQYKRSEQKESSKWQKMMFYKRLDAVDDEIGEIHIMLSQLVDKISNVERVAGLQETKFFKEIIALRKKLGSKKDEDIVLKWKKLSADVAELRSKIGEESASSEEIADKTDESQDSAEEKDKKPTHKMKDESQDSTEEKVKKPIHKMKESIMSSFSVKFDNLSNEITEIKRQLNQQAQSEIRKSESKEDLGKIDAGQDKRDLDEKPHLTKADVSKIDLQLLTLATDLQKLKEKCAAVDKTYNTDFNMLKEKNLILKRNLSQYESEIKLLKASWDEMVHVFQDIKDNVQSIEKEMNALIELPGIRKRLDQLEGYVYSTSGDEYEGAPSTPKRPVFPPGKAIGPPEQLVSKVKKIIKTITVADMTEGETFIPTMKKMERSKAQDIKECIEDDSELADSGLYHGNARRKFQAVARNVALVQDMEKKKHEPKIKEIDSYDDSDDDDDYYPYDEPIYEDVHKSSVEELLELGEPTVSQQNTAEYSKARVKISTFTSPDALEEHSRQLKGQVIVYVKKRLEAFQSDLQHVEGELVSVRKTNEFLSKGLKDVAEKLNFTETNFHQRAGDLHALKNTAENHQISIVNIMHHIDRKAETFVVNQKVSRKDLTVIEDRVLKLCMSISSEITKLEEKVNGSLQAFNLELDKKLYTEEFEVHLESVLHKIKVLETKFRGISVQKPILDSDDIRPVEIKKYVVSKDGTKIRQARRKMDVWNKASYTSHDIIPVFPQHHVDAEVSPKTASRIQKELELASCRESRRYVDGAFTKIKIGRK